MEVKSNLLYVLVLSVIALFLIYSVSVFSYSSNEVKAPFYRSVTEKRKHTGNQFQDPDPPIKKERIHRRYATFYITVPTDIHMYSINAWSKYAFLAPYTVIAWNNIDYRCIVGLIYDGEKMTKDAFKMLKFVADTLLALEAKVLYINVRQQRLRRYSMTLRLYTAHLCKFLSPSTFLMTTSADIWPIRPSRYDLTNNHTILLLNSDCCGKLKYKNKTIKNFPMRIGMSVEKWRLLFPMKFGDKGKSTKKRSSVSLPSVVNRGENKNFYTAEDLLVIDEKFVSMFGRSYYDDVIYPNKGWDMDRTMLSIVLNSYQEQAGSDKIMFLPDSLVKCKRINRNYWEKKINFVKSHCAEDAYVLRNYLFNEKYEYERLTKLMKLIFLPIELEFLHTYRSDFIGYFYGMTK